MTAFRRSGSTAKFRCTTVSKTDGLVFCKAQLLFATPTLRKVLVLAVLVQNPALQLFLQDACFQLAELHIGLLSSLLYSWKNKTQNRTSLISHRQSSRCDF
ncbi:hypothetical protein ACROYT_G014850 [Oculina patagonica]